MEATNIFVVYDPTRSEQPALARAMETARDVACTIHVFAAIHGEIDRTVEKATEIKRLLGAQKEILDSAVAPLLEKGIAVTTEVEWDKDWAGAVVRGSLRNCADVVFKSSYRHSTRERVLKKTSDWVIMRECLCPVLLVKECGLRDTQKILAAIDIRGGNESYGKLNEHIIDFSKRIQDTQRAEVHFFNAFSDLNAVPDRNSLIRSCGVGSDRIHIQMGTPEDVIVQGAQALGASMVVVGNSARTGLSAVFNGNTVENVVGRLECDVLSMP